MAGLDNIVLKEHLKRNLPGKFDKLRCFERVLTDANAKSPEEAYFLLVDEGIYFSDVKCNSLRLATSLRNVADIAIVKTPRIGLVEEYRVQTLQITLRPDADNDEDDDVENVDSAEAAEVAALAPGEAQRSLRNPIASAPEPGNTAGSATTAGGGGGCFGRGRRIKRGSQKTDPPAPPQPPPQTSPPQGPDEDQQRPGGCMPRRRRQQQLQQQQSPGADVTDGGAAATLSAQPPQAAEQPVSGQSAEELNPRPAVTPAAAPAPEVGRAFRILCNVFSSSRSVAYLHLRNTWQMSTLLKTLDMDEDYAESTEPRTPDGQRRRRRRKEGAPPSGLTSAHVAQLFRELRADIVRTQSNMTEAFGFLFELKLSLDRGYPVKRLFWETDDLFRCVVNKLFYYLNKDPALLQGRVTSPAAIRLDELDYCLLSLEILSAVFLDTEFMVERRKTIATQQHYFMQRMIRACAVRIRPCVPNFMYDPAKLRPDHRITARMHIERATLMHHLITYLRETGIRSSNGGMPTMGRSDGSVVSESQVVDLLAAEGDGLLQMLTESIRHLCYQFEGQRQQQNLEEDGDSEAGDQRQWLRPQAVVHAYYLLFLINSVLNFSDPARDYLTRQHREDFRFFISDYKIRARVRPELPVFASLLELAKQVRVQVGIL